jgi:hypothetical protein
MCSRALPHPAGGEAQIMVTQSPDSRGTPTVHLGEGPQRRALSQRLPLPGRRPQSALQEAVSIMRTSLAGVIAGALLAVPAPTRAESSVTLNWEPCGAGLKAYDCATHIVPRDWNTPNSGTWDPLFVKGFEASGC